MQNQPKGEHRDPTRGEAVAFYLKSRLHIIRRWLAEKESPAPVHPQDSRLAGLPVAAAAQAPLWTQISDEEFPLTAGKVQNLRAACLRLHGVEVPAGKVFSFWKQLGRTTRRRGFTTGRELRSGCIVPNRGGGLCQLSGVILNAAIDAGLTVVERHAHSRILPGAALPPERDATVFWNYVDLRFSAPFDWRLECTLNATDLRVAIRVAKSSRALKPRPSLAISGNPVHAAAEGDCMTCGMTSCFRHPAALRHNAPAAGHTAWLLDARWPEFNDWCLRHARDGDRWFTPLDGRRWGKANLAWQLPARAITCHATMQTLLRAWRQRRLPAQGALRQRFLIDAQRKLAETYASMLDPKARHLVVAQTILPYLWQAGHLGGRTFDVLMVRWPLAELHARLDAAAAAHPQSATLGDFRAPRAWVEAESMALAAAARVVTPHRMIAASFGDRAILLDWDMPAPPAGGISHPAPVRWFFPASALGRKGIYELAEALRGTDEELLVLGTAREGAADPLAGIRHRRASADELTSCTALVLPAWIEHEPRLALRALASGIPVIASKVCGLSGHPLLTEINAGDADALRAAMQDRAKRQPTG